MSIYVGNKKVKTLYLNGKIGSVYKGDQLIFRDRDAYYSWAFTVDTTLDVDGGHTETGTDIKFCWTSRNGGTANYDFRVDWGDGAVDEYHGNVGSATTFDFSHTYDEAGEHQIALIPTRYKEDGLPEEGWLAGFKPYYGTSIGIVFPSDDRLRNYSFYKIKSIDKPFPENGFVVGFSNNDDYFKNEMSHAILYAWVNLESAPDGLFDNAKFKEHVSINFSSYAYAVFNGAFYGCAKNTGLNVFELAKPLFEKFNNEWVANYPDQGYFASLFRYAFAYTSTPAVSAGLFNIDTSNNRAFDNMFSYAFYNSGVNTIPAGVFSLNTSKGEDFAAMFQNTFDNTSLTTIPADLFPLDTTNGTNFSSMFSSTFDNTSLTTIPADLFPLDTTNGTNFSSMFSSTFFQTRLGSIPAGLFSHISIQEGADVSNIFNWTFGNISAPESFELVDIFAGMPSFSWATADNASSTLGYMLYTGVGSFLTGSASTILQHFPFTPTARTYMFQNQNELSDYETINDNWK